MRELYPIYEFFTDYDTAKRTIENDLGYYYGDLEYLIYQGRAHYLHSTKKTYVLLYNWNLPLNPLFHGFAKIKNFLEKKGFKVKLGKKANKIGILYALNER